MIKRDMSRGSVKGAYSPAEFAVRVLGLHPYDWQGKTMEAVASGRPCSLVAANGSGKTAMVVAVLVIWFLYKYPRGQVIFTSGSFRQIKKQLWPAIRRFSGKFPEWRFMSEELRTPEGGFAIGYSADNAGNVEGWHPKREDKTDPVFIIIDEAKSVPNEVFEAFDRCTRICELWVSSPGMPRGQFYESHTKNSSLYWTTKVTSHDCPHIDPEIRERDKVKYGIDSPLYRSKHLAEFTEAIGNLILGVEELLNAIENQPIECGDGEVVAFCDFAAGGDENVLAVRRGNKVRIIDAWIDKDPIQAIRRFDYLFHKESLSSGQIWGDSDGLNKVFISALKECGWRINPYFGSASAINRKEYVSLNSEMWHLGVQEIKNKRINLGKLDPTSFDQLTNRRWEWGDRGRLKVESKDKLKKSPDRADAILGCIMCGARMTGAITSDTISQIETANSTFTSTELIF